MTGPVTAAIVAQAAPLVACAIILIGLRGKPAAAAGTAILALTVSFLSAAWLVLQVAVPDTPLLAQVAWLPVQGAAPLAFGVQLDTLSTTMALVVAAITLAVMIYSTGYMAGDPGFGRYFGFLALFGWAMTGLVLASNLLQLLVFWELVGLASFLLIGFWYEKPAPAAAARKAFIMTRVGDVGFLLGILLLIRALGIATIPELTEAATTRLDPGFVSVVAFLLLMGAIGKSAQGPLFTWLPDAMEGPTPVSALLHSATMVAAGVYLVARLHGFFAAAPAVMHGLLWLALVTAIASATMAMVANDIKRVLAYSSISQLAYMFLGLAAGSVAAGFFHLTTHAGFKALLFLASGIFIHHAHSNDMREIATKGRAPAAGRIGLVAGALALAGVIPFSGYFSKEAVLAALGGEAGLAVLALAYLGAGLTAYYTFRMVFLTLRTERGPAAAPAPGHAHHGGAGDRAMAGPVLVLSALTLVLGWLGGWFAARLSPDEVHHGALAFGVGPAVALALVAAGIALAWFEFGRVGAPRLGFVERIPALRDFFGNNWYVDRLYGATVVRLAVALARLARWNEHTVLDGASDGFAAGTVGSGRLLQRVQAGFVQIYLAVLVTLVAALAIWLTWPAGGVR
jgi:NADH-quinone oxidoreductase subunit L